MSSPPSSDPLASAAEPAVVALARSGDGQAFEELVRRNQGAVRRLMRQLCGDWAAADDFAQEAFVQAWRKLHGLRAPGAFGGWLRRIAVNVFLQHLRREDLLVQDPRETASLPATEKKDPTVKMDMERALARLRPGERLCVVLSHGQGLSHGQICSATGLPLGTVKSHIARGCARLRLYLADYEVGVR